MPSAVLPSIQPPLVTKATTPLVADAVGGPADSADVGVVEAVLVRRGRARGVGGFDAAVEGRVLEVGVVVVGAAWPTE